TEDEDQHAQRKLADAEPRQEDRDLWRPAADDEAVGQEHRGHGPAAAQSGFVGHGFLSWGARETANLNRFRRRQSSGSIAAVACVSQDCARRRQGSTRWNDGTGTDPCMTTGLSLPQTKPATCVSAISRACSLALGLPVEAT